MASGMVLLFNTEETLLADGVLNTDAALDNIGPWEWRQCHVLCLRIAVLLENMEELPYKIR